MPPKNIKLLLVGAGHAGSILLNLFSTDKSIEIKGVVDKNSNAPGLAVAKALRIPTASGYQKFIRSSELDLIINVTGDSILHDQLVQQKPARAELIGGASARLIWALLDEYQKKETLQDHFNIIMHEVKTHSSGDFIIGSTKAMREIALMIKQVSPTPATILIRGETGTGKEVIARMIQENSRCSNKPLVSVNCTAFSANLIESELFGYKKGAFTGAESDRVGLLELANNGTVFLDEIGDMPLEMQAKLLRFLQSGEIRPVGSVKNKLIKVRVIAATNKNLEQAIEKGDFRADLYYRLNGFTLNLPSLRDRPGDIPLLTYHFLKRAQERINKRVETVSPEAITALSRYQWPGNLRELENVIERAVILASNQQITVADLPLKFQSKTPDMDFDGRELEDGLISLKKRQANLLEQQALSQYLLENNGNITRAAQSAKISRRTYHRLMEKHGIKKVSFK
ncbi:MAG: sigma 54-interacting transcriptional regulator [SAR324 cluster bacterium]|nr:sigma 54-interacting transcriptional regulator [SAR324 cluster bacterium]